MKKAYFLLIAIGIGFSSCSKCYECVEQQNILDASGNVIDQTEVHESVCTADENEISERESNGAVCS